MKLFIHLCIASGLFFGCASGQGVGATETSLPVEKRFKLDGESSTFKARVRLPCAKDCTEIEDPKVLEVASKQLVAGLDDKILSAARTTLSNACAITSTCDARSEQLWDHFYELAQRVEVEHEHSLDEYLSGLRIALADAWRIERICSKEASLCRSLSTDVVGAPEMITDLVLRDALLRQIGLEASFADLVDSMGHMLAKKSD